MRRNGKGKNSQKKNSRSRGRSRNRGTGIVTGTGANAATTKVRGSARADQKYTLPLLGDKFENKRILYFDYAFEHNVTGGVLKTHYFRANDLFDPDATGTGHQPIGFDQAMLFWEQFVVFSSKITVTFMSNHANTSRVGIFLSPDQTDPASIQTMMENGYLITDVVASSAASSSGHLLVKQLTLTFDATRYFSFKSREEYFANSQFTGNVGASPSELAYFCIFTYDFAGSSNYDVFYDVTLSYDARFWEPRKISTSLMRGVHQYLFENSEGKRDEEEYHFQVGSSDPRPSCLKRVAKGVLPSESTARVQSIQKSEALSFPLGPNWAKGTVLSPVLGQYGT